MGDIGDATSTVVGEQLIGPPLSETMLRVEEKCKPPVLISPEAYRNMTKHVNACPHPITEDVLRFDCAEMEKRLMEFLYESDEWMQAVNRGHMEWKDEHEPTGKERCVEYPPSKENEVGGRATYLRPRMIEIESSPNEAYGPTSIDLAKFGPSFAMRSRKRDE